MDSYIALTAEVQALLLTVHPRVSNVDSNEQLDFPYLTFDLLEVTDVTEDGSTLLMDVDGFDLTDDSTAIMNIMASVDAALNTRTVINSDIAVSYYRDRREKLKESDTRLKHFRYTYLVHLSEVEV